MLPLVAVAVAVLLIAPFAYAATKPDTFRIQRSTSIQSSPEKIFPLIADFRSWAAWSPWEKLDPDMKRTHSGPTKGKGAVYEWDGNRKAGAGRMEITESSPSKLTIKLDFIKPFEGHNVAEFTLEPSGDATTVTWAMHGPNQYMSKVMTLVVSMDSLVGKDFEAGLAALKAVAETES